MSLEDEFGIINLIVWPSVQTSQRKAVFGAHLILVPGELQNERSVIHVIANKFATSRTGSGDSKSNPGISTRQPQIVSRPVIRISK